MDLSAFGEFAQSIVDWIMSYGAVWVYVAIIVASFIENIFPPFPGDTVTVIGAALAARDGLSFTLVFAAAYLGGILSTLLIYWFGRRHGHSYFMERDFKYFPRAKVIEFEQWLARSGSWLITGHRFIVGFRTVVAVAAGVARWPAPRMILFGSLSFFIFNAVLMTATYLLVDNLELLVRLISLYKTYFLIALALVILVIVYRKLLRPKRSQNGE